MDITKFKLKHSIKNSAELSNQLKNFDISNNTIMASLDVVNLFTSILKNETIALTYNLLHSSNLSINDKIDIITRLKSALSQDFFQLKNKIYQQNESLLMGSPLSCLMLEISMDNLENIILSNPANSKIKHWFRHVDDCFILPEGSVDDANQILNSSLKSSQK